MIVRAPTMARLTELFRQLLLLVPKLNQFGLIVESGRKDTREQL